MMNCFVVVVEGVQCSPHENTCNLNVYFNRIKFYFQALCGSIHRYLQFYRSAVMMLSEEPVLTRLRQQVDGLHIQMTSLGHLCKVHPNTSQEDGKLPEGVALLAYLYQEICKVTRKDVACILYSALHACCQVYFRYP